MAAQAHPPIQEAFDAYRTYFHNPPIHQLGYSALLALGVPLDLVSLFISLFRF